MLIGTPGEGSTLREMPILLVNVLGAKLKLIGGCAGSSEILVAIERNEVHGMCGMGYSSISMQRGEWLRNGTLHILVQEDMKGHPEVNKLGVPLAASFAKTEEDRQVMEMLYGKNEFGRPFVLPEGVPADRVAALRCARLSSQRCRTRRRWRKPPSSAWTWARWKAAPCRRWWRSSTRCRRR